MALTWLNSDWVERAPFTGEVTDPHLAQLDPTVLGISFSRITIKHASRFGQRWALPVTAFAKSN
jgi:hypothetical protein